MAASQSTSYQSAHVWLSWSNAVSLGHKNLGKKATGRRRTGFFFFLIGMNLLVVLNGAGYGHADVKHLAVSLRVGVIASYDLVATSEGSFRHVLLRVSGWWSLQPEDAGSERGNHCHRMGNRSDKKGENQQRTDNTLTFRRVKLLNSLQR